METNPYRAPKAQLNLSKEVVEVTPAMVESLTRAAFWARLINVMNWVSVTLTVVEVMMSVVSGKYDDILGSIISIVIYCLLAVAAGRYASSAKALNFKGNIDDVAACFAASTRYFKITGICFMIMGGFFILGLAIAAVTSLGQ